MRLAALVIAAALAAPALAGPPAVATDIPPVHSLVARVMQGVGEPALILPPGASPHGYAMRPSEAAALAGADLVVWMGPALTPWLARAIGSLAPDAGSLELLEAEGTTLLEFRDGADFEQAGEHAGAGHAGAGLAKEGHARDGSAQDGRAEAGSAEGESAEDGRDHTGIDPHAWLDPENAKAWLAAIAERLSDLDPENAGAYAANAGRAWAEIDALAAEIAAELAPVRGVPFIVFHDGYHYFEHRFGVEAAGAIAAGDAAPPGPARIAGVRGVVARTGAACVFAEPQLSRGLVDTVTEGTGARAATLDPLGVTLPPGPDLYPRLLRGLATALRDCLASP